MKFNNFYKIATFRYFLLLGEQVNVKAFLSLTSDDFKYEFAQPSTMLLLELFEEDYLSNTTGLPEVKGTVRVKYND